MLHILQFKFYKNIFFQAAFIYALYVSPAFKIKWFLCIILKMLVSVLYTQTQSFRLHFIKSIVQHNY